MNKRRSHLVTIIGEAYFQPIADLVDWWLLRKSSAPNKVKSDFYENGYAAAVVLLLVGMFESYVSRLRFVQGPKVPAEERSAVHVVLAVYPHLRHRKALQDVYVLRDVLIHNHLWEINYEWGGSPPMVLKKATKHRAYGDKKYTCRVNLNTRHTKALALSVLSSRVDRRDTLKIFDTIWKTLLLFENTDHNQCNVSYQNVRFRGKTIPFSALRDRIKDTL